MSAASDRATQRLRAALDEQRAALGEPAWTGPGRPRTHTAALREAARYLAVLLAAQAPGRAVEVRVPPYAAVQCIDGPRHTRGTPPNLVEMDPVTWVRLALGLTRWAEARAAGAVRASGVRADLGPYLPVLKMPGVVGAEH